MFQWAFHRICIYIYAYVYTYIHIHIIYVYIYIYICIYIQIYIYLNIYIYTYTYEPHIVQYCSIHSYMFLQLWHTTGKQTTQKDLAALTTNGWSLSSAFFCNHHRSTLPILNRQTCTVFAYLIHPLFRKPHPVDEQSVQSAYKPFI